MIPEINPRVEHWLFEWARSLRPNIADEMKLGFPKRVKPFIGGGESRRGGDFDEDQNIAIWQRNCEAMNGLIMSLPKTQKCAVCHVYAGDVWEYPQDNLLELLEKASQTLLIGMNARAVI